MVTIDAMGRQTAIAQQIVVAGADYCLAVKKNQGKTFQAIDEFFFANLEDDCESIDCRKLVTTDHGHGREEERSYYLAKLPLDSTLKKKWPTVKAIGLVCRVARDTQGRESCETRYYLVSKYLSIKKFAAAVRGHWAIENSLHWQLDVTFGEDQCRLRQGHASQNISHIRKLVLALLKQDKKTKCGIKNKRLKAGWDDDYRMQILRA